MPLDPGLPGWGDSRYVRLTLTGEMRLADALSHLYVLLPVLDGTKHYWVTADEVDKLLRAGEGWLSGHPERAWITRRYLSRKQRLFRQAIARLAEVDDLTEPDEADHPTQESDPAQEEAPDTDAAAPQTAAASSGRRDPDDDGPREPSLADQRAGAVLSVLKSEGAQRVLDLGCGTGKLVGRLLDDPAFTLVTGVDVSADSIGYAHRRLRVERMPESRRRRLELLVGSALYRDRRFSGHDAIVLMEVIEHIDPARLPALEQVVFGGAAPRAIVVTTPNAEYNAHYEGLADGGFRHADHRFEWTRAEFRAWADNVARTHGYRVRYLPVGQDDPQVGAPTQMGVFTR